MSTFLVEIVPCQPSVLIRNAVRIILDGIRLKIKTLFEKRTVAMVPDMVPEGSLLANPSLVVTDLHIGFEEKFKSSGINIEPNVDKMTAELENLIDENNADRLIIAGDVKSGIDRILQSEWENVPKFLGRLSKKCHVTIVPGNHDGGLQNLVPDQVQVADINGIVVGDTLIIHGHTRPLPKFSNCKRILMGHVHPIYQKRGSPLSGMPVWVFVRVSRKALFQEIIPDEEDSMVEVTVIPSFNLDLMVSGYISDEINTERRLSPIVRELRSAPEAIITTLNAEVIGDSSLLSAVL